MSKPHQKHAKLLRPFEGAWGRNELAVLGAPCGVIRELVLGVAVALDGRWKVGFADAVHYGEINEPILPKGLAMQFIKQEYSQQIEATAPLNLFSQKALFAGQDLVLVNGNHFVAEQQIVIVHPDKDLEKKTAVLTDMALVLLADGVNDVPVWLQAKVAEGCAVLALNDTTAIAGWMNDYLLQHVALLNGLVLSGGKSVRMGMDKGSIHYHGKGQREYVYGQMLPLCDAVFISCNREQAATETLPFLEDTFLGLGPIGGILTAMQYNPQVAWLTVACDLPYLSEATLHYLVAQRNPAKVATAFMDSGGKFPEPLITIWEPRAYPVLLQALSQGYSCPRKVLINSDVTLLQAPSVQDLENINDPYASSEAMRRLQEKAAS